MVSKRIAFPPTEQEHCVSSLQRRDLAAFAGSLVDDCRAAVGQLLRSKNSMYLNDQPIVVAKSIIAKPLSP